MFKHILISDFLKEDPKNFTAQSVSIKKLSDTKYFKEQKLSEVSKINENVRVKIV